MTINDLAQIVAAKKGGTKADAKEAIATVLDGILEAVKIDKEISLAGFGRFKVKDVSARSGRNPKTGEVVQIAATKKLVFVPAKSVKEAVSH